MDFLIMVAGILQLNSMHIGNNKSFSVLLHNAKQTKVNRKNVLSNSFTKKKTHILD